MPHLLLDVELNQGSYKHEVTVAIFSPVPSTERSLQKTHINPLHCEARLRCAAVLRNTTYPFIYVAMSQRHEQLLLL